MSLHDYQYSLKPELRDAPFYALLFAMIRRADSANIEKIRAMWPKEYAEMEARYNALGGLLENERM